MAATYGYGGEFSSDEDIDRMEQQSERLTQSKFDSYAQMKPTKHQVEETIEVIRRTPIDQGFNASDELLAGLLDYYQVQRGPIVDSTRSLYKNIILRMVRGQQSSNGNDSSKDTNGNVNLIKKTQEIDITQSSDEDEPMPPASSQSSVEQNKRKFDSRVVYNEKLEPMEVDSEATDQLSAIRNTKPVDMSSSEDSETEESSDESTEDSEVLNVTPIKPQAAAPAKATSTPLASAVKLTEAKKAASVDPKKKPYTRSQRVAASKATSSSAKKTDVTSGKAEASPVTQTVAKPLAKSAQSSKFKVRYLVSALLVIVLALFLYYFKSDLTKTTDRLLSKAIKF